MAKRVVRPTYTRRELAALLGVHPQTVVKWENDGAPVAQRGGRGVASKYDLAAIVEWRIEAARKAAGADAVSLEAERARLTRAHALKTERENLARAGELVPVEQVTAEGQAYTKAWAAKVRALPRLLVQAGLIGREHEAGAAKLCRDILTEIASWKTVADCDAASRVAEAPGV